MEEVRPGLSRLPIPLPYPTKPVNAYLGRVDGGWAVVDTGAHTPETEQLWDAALARLDGPLVAIYATHYHPDHLGMAGWLRERTGASVHMMELEYRWAQRMWADGMPQADNTAALFRRYGMPADVAEGVKQGMIRQRRDTVPLPDAIEPVAEGELLPLGGVARWRVMHLPGHADGLYCLWEEQGRTLISTDLVLPTITPNVAVWPGAEPRPLGRFLESLQRALALEPQLFLPGHGDPFGPDAGRVEKILGHHERRLARMCDAVGAGATGYAVCDAIFTAADLSPHQMRFAMAETLAHLELLVERGELRVAGDEPVRYEVVK